MQQSLNGKKRIFLLLLNSMHEITEANDQNSNNNLLFKALPVLCYQSTFVVTKKY